MDAAARLDRAQRLRATVADPVELVATAKRVIDALPDGCRHLVAFCPEGYALGAAAMTLACSEGRDVRVHRASLVAPLAQGPQEPGWHWMNVEEAFGLGRVRSWVVEWAHQRGGAEPSTPIRQPTLAQVA